MAGIDSDTFIKQTMPDLIRAKLPSAVIVDTGFGKLLYDVKLYDGIVFSFSRADYKRTDYGSTYSYVFSFTKEGVCFKERYSNETLALAALDEFLTNKPTLPTWVFAKLEPRMQADGYTVFLTSRRLSTFTFYIQHLASGNTRSRTLKVFFYNGQWNIEISKKLEVGVTAFDVGAVESALKDNSTTTAMLSGKVPGDIDVCHVLNRLTALLVLE